MLAASVFIGAAFAKDKTVVKEVNSAPTCAAPGDYIWLEAATAIDELNWGCSDEGARFCQFCGVWYGTDRDCRATCSFSSNLEGTAKGSFSHQCSAYVKMGTVGTSATITMSNIRNAWRCSLNSYNGCAAAAPKQTLTVSIQECCVGDWAARMHRYCPEHRDSTGNWVKAKSCTAGKCVYESRFPQAAPSCGGTIKLTMPAETGVKTRIYPKISGLTGCEHILGFITTQSCDKYSYLQGQEAIDASDEKVEAFFATGGVGNFKAPEKAGTYTYYACIDTNGDGDFTDAGESSSASVTVFSNEHPVPQMKITPNPPFVGEPTLFDGRASYDPDGTITSYELKFDDGTVSNEQFTTHTFTKAGTSAFMFTVMDNRNSGGAIIYVFGVQPFRITDVTATTDADLRQAVLKWKTAVGSSAVIDYGTKKSYGQKYTETVSTTSHEAVLPNVDPGKIYYYRISATDANNDKTEYEGYFTSGTAPELYISSITVDYEGKSYELESGAMLPVQPQNLPGKSYTIRLKVANSGTADARVVRTVGYVNGKYWSIIGEADNNIAGGYTPPKTIELTKSDSQGKAGTYTYKFVTDYEEQNAEMDETNNEVTFKVKVVAAPKAPAQAKKPDLTVSSLSVSPSTRYVKSPLSIAVSWKNKGEATAKDTKLVVKITYPDKIFEILKVATVPKGRMSGSEVISWTPQASGLYSVEAGIDKDIVGTTQEGVIDESDETNNVAKHAFIIQSQQVGCGQEFVTKRDEKVSVPDVNAFLKVTNVVYKTSSDEPPVVTLDYVEVEAQKEGKTEKKQLHADEKVGFFNNPFKVTLKGIEAGGGIKLSVSDCTLLDLSFQSTGRVVIAASTKAEQKTDINLLVRESVKTVVAATGGTGATGTSGVAGGVTGGVMSTSATTQKVEVPEYKIALYYAERTTTGTTTGVTTAERTTTGVTTGTTATSKVSAGTTPVGGQVATTIGPKWNYIGDVTVPKHEITATETNELKYEWTVPGDLLVKAQPLDQNVSKSYYLKAVIDEENAAAETTENNNAGTSGNFKVA